MNKDFAILTQASCDLPPERLKAQDILVVPMPMSIDNLTYHHNPSGKGISFSEFYKMLRENKVVRTSAPSPQDFIAAAEPALKKGLDILYLGISSTLSGTFQSGVLAMNMLKEAYPEREIICVDTKSGAMGEALLVEMAAKARKEGKTLQETAELIERNKLKTAHYFTLDDMEALSRSGRLPAYRAVIGNLLDIKPVIKLSSDSTFAVVAKVRGYKKALSKLCEMVLSKAEELKDQIVYISHADVKQAAEQLAEKFRIAGAREVVITLLGPAIAGHFGIGGIGVSFLAGKR